MTDEEPDITVFARAQDWRHLTDPDRPRRTRPSFTRFVNHATRGPGDPVDLEVERYIRKSEGARRFYFGLLDRVAEASSPVALAASGEKVTERRLGQNLVELIREDSGDYLVVTIPDAGASPYEIEARGRNADGVRVPIGVAIDDVISIRLDARFPELKELQQLLEDPTSSLWLLRILERS